MDVVVKLFLIVGMLTMLISMGLLLTTNKRIESILYKIISVGLIVFVAFGITVIWRL